MEQIQRFTVQIVKVAPLLIIPVVALGIGYRALDGYVNGEHLEASYCYSERIHYEAAFAIDASVNISISERQGMDFEQVMRNAFDNLPANGRLSIFSTARTNARTVFEPVFEICRPANTAAEQEMVGIGKLNGAQLSNLGEEAFDAYWSQVQPIIEQLQDPLRNADDSPIIEMVRSVSRYYETGQLDEFHIWTDGVNNSQARRMCVVAGHLLPYSHFPKSRDYQYLRPERLDGVETYLWLVEHTKYPNAQAPHCNNNEIRDWWPAFLEDHGMRVTVDYLTHF